MSYKIVVVDDNPVIRESIIKTIAWSELDCVVIGDAGDGVEGKRIITENKPDIIITDIRMPGIDGLELAEYTMSLIPSSKLILITGYTDFENAQKAVKLNAFDFILKPIKNKELFNVVKSAVEKIKEEQDKNAKMSKIMQEKSLLEQQYNSSLSQLKNKILADIFTGNYNGKEDFLTKMNVLELDANRYLTIIVRVHNAFMQNADNYLEIVSNSIHDLKISHGLDIRDGCINKDVVCLVLFKKVFSVREVKNKVRKIYTDLDGRVFKQLNCKCCFAVSSLYKSFSDMHNSYNEALETARITFFKPDKELFFADEWCNRNSLGSFSIISELEGFYENFGELTDSDISGYIQALIEKIISYSNGNIFTTKVLLSQVCITTTRFYLIRTGDSEVDYYKNFQETLTDINKFEDINHASQYVKDFVIRVRSMLKSRLKKFSPIVGKVLEYINTSFSEDITLDSVAALFSLSPSYLCRLLKKETGENFVDIVSKARISAAKKLLKNPNNKVYEVALKVGYENYAYFYQVFKRVEGINPKEYCRAGHLPGLN